MKTVDHKDDTIVIKVQSGNLKYEYASDDSSAKRHVTERGQYVRWTSQAGNFTIVFGQHSPFAHPCYSKKKGEILSIPVNSERKTRGPYKYSVVVEVK
jgi:hypothetical protein